MKVEYFKEYSRNLNRDMEFKVFGHAGKACIAFPCQNGRFFDYENQGMINAIKWYIDNGMIQVFCVDSIDSESWSDNNKNPRWRIETQEAYYRYIVEELVPRVYSINPGHNGGIMTFGCSMGAYHSMNFFLRRPDIFDSVLSLSGIYRASYFFGNYSDDLTFLNSPIDSLRMMDRNHYYVDLYKRAKIIVCVGQGAWENECLEDTRTLDSLVRGLGIPAWFDYCLEAFLGRKMYIYLFLQ